MQSGSAVMVSVRVRPATKALGTTKLDQRRAIAVFNDDSAASGGDKREYVFFRPPESAAAGQTFTFDRVWDDATTQARTEPRLTLAQHPRHPSARRAAVPGSFALPVVPRLSLSL